MNDLATSCVACNNFQNNLSWNIHLNALAQIAKIEEYKDVSPLTPNEYRWLMATRKAGSVKCPKAVRLQLFVRDGRYCRASGTKMVFKSYCWNTVSYDRINSKLPYTFENTRLVCKHINYVKMRSITESELQAWLAHIRVQFATSDNFFDAAYEAHFKKRKTVE